MKSTDDCDEFPGWSEEATASIRRSRRQKAVFEGCLLVFFFIWLLSGITAIILYTVIFLDKILSP